MILKLYIHIKSKNDLAGKKKSIVTNYLKCARQHKPLIYFILTLYSLLFYLTNSVHVLTRSENDIKKKIFQAKQRIKKCMNYGRLIFTKTMYISLCFTRSLNQSDRAMHLHNACTLFFFGQQIRKGKSVLKENRSKKCDVIK